MIAAWDKQMVISLAEGALVMKFLGKPTALCTETLVTAHGAFVKGNWYSPADEITRYRYKENFFEGIGHVEELGGKWALMRGMDREGGYASYLPRWVRAGVLTIPEELSGTRELRELKYEAFKNAHVNIDA